MWKYGRMKILFTVLLPLFILSYNSNHQCYAKLLEVKLKNTKNTNNVKHYYPPIAAPPTSIESKDVRDIVVGNFRITYSAPKATTQPDTTQTEDAAYITLFYLQEAVPSLLGIDTEIRQQVEYKWTFTNNNKQFISQWTNYRVTFDTEGIDSDKDLSPESIYNAVDIAISNNATYLAYVKALIGTPFEDVTAVVVSDYSKATESPTSAPVPTSSPVIFVTPSAGPVVQVNIGDFTVAYTSPGKTEPSIEEYLNVIGTNDFYYYDAVQGFHPKPFFYVTYSEFTYEYVNPDASPNILTTFTNYTFFFELDENHKNDENDAFITESVKADEEIPSADDIKQILSDATNATYLDLINGLMGQPFSTVTEAFVIFDGIPAPTPTPPVPTPTAPVGPVPVPIPIPVPLPVPIPVPTPPTKPTPTVPVPFPVPVPLPEPVPEPVPAPEPGPLPVPVPVPAPVPDSFPVPAPIPASMPVPLPVPVPVPVPTPRRPTPTLPTPTIVDDTPEPTALLITDTPVAKSKRKHNNGDF